MEEYKKKLDAWDAERARLETLRLSSIKNQNYVDPDMAASNPLPFAAAPLSDLFTEVRALRLDITNLVKRIEEISVNLTLRINKLENFIKDKPMDESEGKLNRLYERLYREAANINLAAQTKTDPPPPTSIAAPRSDLSTQVRSLGLDIDRYVKILQDQIASLAKRLEDLESMVIVRLESLEMKVGD